MRQPCVRYHHLPDLLRPPVPFFRRRDDVGMASGPVPCDQVRTEQLEGVLDHISGHSAEADIPASYQDVAPQVVDRHDQL